MKTFNARGLVLREYEAGESDKRLLLLCKGVGRLFVYARGERNPKSKFLATAQLFTYGDFTLAQGRGFYSLTQAAPIESFYHLRTDYDALTCAHVIVEICEKTLLEEENCDDLLRLTLKALGHLSRATHPPRQVLAVFMLRFFAWYGVAPFTENCLVCGNPDAPRLSPEGTTCRQHPAPSDGITLSASALTATRYIFNSEPAAAFQFNAAPTVVDDLYRAAMLLWRHHFDTPLRSATFLE